MASQQSDQSNSNPNSSTSSSSNLQSSSSSSNPQSTSNSNPNQSSSSGSGTQSIASTQPIDSDYQAEILSTREAVGWGTLTPINDLKFHAFNLRGEEDIKFGRNPNCSYVFDKDRHNLTENEYLNISKVQFVIKKTDDSVLLRDTSSNGTFVGKHLVGKRVSYPLVHLNKISMSLPDNEVFQYIDKEVTKQEERTMPIAFKEKYSIENVVLGEGATGVVKKCFLINDPSQKFAVKILKKGKSFQVVKDFGYESSILSTVQHPNIVEVKDSYENEHTVYMVMELVQGGELFDFIKNEGALKESIAVDHFKQLLEGVSYLHTRGITHRDLKPENVLLNDKKNPSTLKITDFGLSRFVSETSLMETLVGTPSYLAPEILNPLARGYTKKVDAWSLGCILYIMLGGYPPFSTDNADGNADLYTAIKNGDYTFHEERWEHISDNAKDLVRKMLTVNPSKRIDVKDSLDHEWFKSAQPRKRRKTEE